MQYIEKLWSLRWPILMLVVLQAFDTLSTVLALGVGGGEEGNPIMSALQSDGWGGMVVAKWAVIVLVFVAVAIDDLKTPYVPAAIIVMDIVYAFVLSGNFTAYGLATGRWALPVAFWALMLTIAIVAVEQVFFRPRPEPAPDD